MKILHLLQSNHFSGAENVVCQIIKMFDGDKHIQMAYCSCDGQVREEVERQGIRFIPIRELSVKKIIKYEKPDMIHAHDMRASFVVACSCGSIPFVSHIHNNAFDSRGVSIKSVAYWFAAVRAKHIFWVSNSSYEGYKFHRSLKGKSSVLYNVIDIDALYNKMDTDDKSYDYDIVYIGRLTFPKNPERLIRIMRMVVEKKSDVKIAIVGTGDLDKETRRLTMDLKLDDNISFLGFQSNPLKILYDAKVMVMTSRWEGTPMCALEAMALGVPIVATAVDGLKDLVINGKTGLLCDDDHRLALGLVRIISDGRFHDQLSKNSVEMSQQLNDLESYRSAIMRGYGKAK